MNSHTSELLRLLAGTAPLKSCLSSVGGKKTVYCRGITDAAKPALIAATLIKMGRPLVVLAPDQKRQEVLFSDIKAYLEAAGVEHAVSFFTEQEPIDDEAIVADAELDAERVVLLARLATEGLRKHEIIVTTDGAWRQPLTDPEALRNEIIPLRKGETLVLDDLCARLVSNGFENAKAVHSFGQFSRRGGILDIFPLNTLRPVRLEFFGNEIESIREFDVDSQTSVGTLNEVKILLGVDRRVKDGGPIAFLDEYLGEGFITIRDEGDDDADDAAGGDVHFVLSSQPADDGFHFLAHSFNADVMADIVIHEQRRALFFRQLKEWIAEGWDIYIYGNNEGELHRLREVLSEAGIVLTAKTRLEVAALLHGFLVPDAKMVVLSDAEIFGRYQTLRMLRRQERLAKMRAAGAAVDFSDIAEGDYVVHLRHGIGLYSGLQQMPVEGRDQEVMVITYAESSKLYVPIDQAYLVSKYVGVGRRHPTLDTLGGSRWERAKVAAHKAVLDYAAQLLKVHAERETQKGYAFPPDGKWQHEFEDAFLYEETSDQEKAILDSKQDMESDKPMDRLICGDVGFGKTEVAIRAIFKCVTTGKQAAFLCPTTVLAQQHYKTLCERFADYPITIDILSRFRTQKQQKDTIKALVLGKVDVVIGTHRLISKDVQFKDLGLVIVDEEQRFGVVQKEKFKDRFRLVDMLTLSATPIPRTLYLALSGARDMSTIETPPKNRIPVETVIAAYDERIIRTAIERERERGGQVYFLHNRVETILHVRDRLKELVPGAKIDVGHGQMHEDELEAVMLNFVEGRSDVLVSTTIIESGLDIPNANTIIIDRADRFGLADLYQLRGRVGRAGNRAYAYLLLPRHLMIQQNARKRVSAIKQYSSLGAGFKIAMRDLEIRGAGNILGTQQSGHIIAIGFDLYCHLLKSTIAQLKGEKLPMRVDVPVRLDFIRTREESFSGESGIEGAWITSSFISETTDRIAAYRRMAEVSSLDELNQLKVSFRDRYGKFPKPVDLMFLLTEIKVRCAVFNVSDLEVKEGKIMARRGGDFVMVGGKFPRLLESSAKSRLNELIKFLQAFEGNVSKRATKP
ncbi:MAG: transcription-repair coupling factor [Verrucomicrobiota bacterium]|nr:transcription-repair coupling factor [Verrucomicrobiota bacterium]